MDRKFFIAHNKQIKITKYVAICGLIAQDRSLSDNREFVLTAPTGR